MKNVKGNHTVTRRPGAVKSKTGARESVRERLLDSAVILFAEKGYDGVAVDDIVGRAEVNKRMVYHYFGSKEGIYGEVLRRVFQQLEEIEEALFARRCSGEDPGIAMEEMVCAYFSFLQKHPGFVRLLLWENLNEGRHLEMLEQPVTKSPMLVHLTTLLKRGEKAGRFRPNLDPRSVLTSLIGLCLIYFSNRHTLSTTIGVNMTSEAFLRRAAKNSCEILLYGISRTG